MKARQIRDMDESELLEHVATLRKEVFGLRFSNATGELDDTSGIGRARRDLARALTVARERTLRQRRRQDN
ncbi:MAG: 50S ribosomal protein L29 [Solirubrobacteraceae bacterium]